MSPPLQIAQRLVGAKGSYEVTHAIVKGTHRSSVFKSKVLAGSGSLAPGSWAFIKTSTPERKKFLRTEYNSYQKPAISSSPFIRRMCDIIGNSKDLENTEPQSDPPHLVFEWMDCTLADLTPGDHLQNDVLYKAIFEAGLNSLVAFHKEVLVHTDFKPDNILLSRLDTPTPIAKIGDLGTTAPDGFDKWRTQPYAMRAPEVWLGYGCSHRSDVWSLAATVLVWMKPGILGTYGIQEGLWPEIWCMPKLMGLFPVWTGLPAATPAIQKDVALSRSFSEAEDPDQPGEPFIKSSPLNDELQALGISREVSDLIRYLLVPDPDERPGAVEALASSEWKALVQKVSGSTGM